MQSQCQRAEVTAHGGCEALPRSQAEIHACGALLQQSTWVPHDPSPNPQTTPRSPPELHKADKPIQQSLGSQKDWLENVVLASVTKNCNKVRNVPVELMVMMSQGRHRKVDSPENTKTTSHSRNIQLFNPSPAL